MSEILNDIMKILLHIKNHLDDLNSFDNIDRIPFLFPSTLKEKILGKDKLFFKFYFYNLHLRIFQRKKSNKSIQLLRKIFFRGL